MKAITYTCRALKLDSSRMRVLVEQSAATVASFQHDRLRLCPECGRPFGGDKSRLW